jgi:pimeloyl-ACP methyl ester carboxylesterase
MNHPEESDRALQARLEASAARSSDRAGGCDVAWRRWGQGRPVLLLHGGHGSWRHWLRNIEPLAQRRRVLACDLPGFAESGDAPEGAGPEALAALLAPQLLARLAPDEPVDLLAFSFGGTVAGALAQQLGARVPQLVLVGSAGLGYSKFTGAGLKPWRQLPAGPERDAILRNNLRELMVLRDQSINAWTLQAYTEDSERTRFRSRDISRTPVLRTLLPGLSARVCGIWGSGDATARPDVRERGEILHALRPDARFEVLEGTGHWAQYEDAERFNALLADVLP